MRKLISSLRSRRRAQEDGFALVLAILALMLLTFLGLAVATSTSTELQVATNYRWSQQALYNAEAGIEVGRQVLMNVNWDTVLPTARGNTWAFNATTGAIIPSTLPLPGMPYTVPGTTTRNFEMKDCDTRGGLVGYGAILDDQAATGALQYVTTYRNQAVNGAFTVWVRRAVVNKDTPPNDYWEDDPNNRVLIITAEGIAPFTNAQATSATAGRYAARRVLEATLRMSEGDEKSESCEGPKGGQKGGGPEGSGFGGCGAVTAANLKTSLGIGGTVTENAVQ